MSLRVTKGSERSSAPIPLTWHSARVYDQPQGQVANVERLLQVLAIMRASENGVSRTRLMEDVPGYANKLRSGTKPDSVIKTMQLDVRALRDIGFVIDDVASEGAESRFVLRETSWRVPVDLSEFDRGLLAWVFPATAAVDAEDDRPLTTAPDAYHALLGSMPPELGVVQAALAGRRSLVVERRGEDQVIEPARLVLHARRWMLLARFPGSAQAYGFRVDTLDEVRLGEPLSAPPDPVEPLEILDPTCWRVDADAAEAEVRCSPEDLTRVSSWFPRADVCREGGESVLRFPIRHEAALIDRIIGLAGAARLVAPSSAVATLRDRLHAVVGVS